MEPDCIIKVKNVYKKYKTDFIIRGLNMNIPKGHIYGLLGPSGCGKTTLLRCILGKLDIDGGSIQLSVSKWRNIGFMPQTVALHADLTIRECFIFYGTVFGMSKEQIREKTNEFCDLLELPSLTNIVGNCSGGQQRRISLAITLFHDPELLILDEPTVGLDPLLAYRICKYLKNLTIIHNKTILVTTHYMEEARDLHMIGLMRGGVLLAEKPPTELINELNCTSLDDVFVELIKKKQDTGSNVEAPQRVALPKDLVKSLPKIENEKKFDTSHVRAQIYKNYKWTLRNKLVTLFVLSLPIVTSIIVGVEFKSLHLTRDLVYFNEELSNASCSDKDVVHVEDCKPSRLFSCIFLDIMGEKQQLRKIDSLEEGLELVRRGRTYALMHIPLNFTSSIINRMSFRPNEINITVEFETPIQIWLDNTIYAIAYQVQRDLYRSLQQLIERKCVECDINIKLAQTSMTFRPELVYGANNTLSSVIFPTLTNTCAFYLAFVYAAASILMEICSGVYDRLQANGMTAAELLTANFLVHIVLSVIQNILTLFTIFVVLGENYFGSITLMNAILILSQVHGSVFALFLHTYNLTSFASQIIGMAIAIAIILTNGMVWPIEGTYWTLKPIAVYSPITMLCKSFENVIMRGFGLMHPLVYLGVVNNLFCVFLWLSLLIYRVKYCNSQI